MAALCLCRKGFITGAEVTVHVDKVTVHVDNTKPVVPRHLSAFSFKAMGLPLFTNAPKSEFVLLGNKFVQGQIQMKKVLAFCPGRVSKIPSFRMKYFNTCIMENTQLLLFPNNSCC